MGGYGDGEWCGPAGRGKEVEMRRKLGAVMTGGKGGESCERSEMACLLFFLHFEARPLGLKVRRGIGVMQR
jgi:hypothetical protein